MSSIEPSSESVTPQTSLEQSLQQLRQQLQALFALQERELKLVVDLKHTQIAELTQQKAVILNTIKQLDGYLSQHPDLQQLKDDPERAAEVNELTELLAACQQQTKVNEQVVGATLNRIETLRETLIRTHRADSLTYDGKGRIR